MDKDFLQPIIRRSMLNHALLAALLVAIAVIAATQGINYYYNMFNGPFRVSKNALLNLDALEGLEAYYITIEGDEAFDTGYEMVTKWNGLVETGRTRYGVLLLDDQFLLYAAGNEIDEIPSPVLTGALSYIDSDARQILDGVYSDVPELRGAILPYMLNTRSDFMLNGVLGIAAEIALLLGAVFFLYRFLRYLEDPAKHPVMQGFQRYGQNSERAVQHFQREMNTDHATMGKLHMTKNWLANVQASSLTTMLMRDVIWMYRKTTQHRTNGIRTGQTHAAIFYDRYGTMMEVKSRESTVNDMLTAVATRSPYAFMGYDKALESAWKSQRDAMVQAVDERRQQAADAR